MKDKPSTSLVAYITIFLILGACGRPIELIDETERQVIFKVNPSFLCNSPSCILNVYYKIVDNGGISEAEAKLELTDPAGEVSVLRDEPATDQVIEYQASVPGDDNSVWTEGTGVYVFSFSASGEDLGATGEAHVSREVILFKDSYSIPHSSSIIVDVFNQHQVKDIVGIGNINVEGEKFNSFYQVCDKGLVITGITYDEALSVFGSQADHPKKLEIKGMRMNGDPVFVYSLNPSDYVELQPIELSEPIVLETSAEPGQTPYPQSASVRWKLIFHLGCQTI